MRRKLWFSFALLVAISTLWCGSSFAASVSIGGYVASYNCYIEQLPPSDPLWLDEYGPVVGTAYTDFEASNCGVGVTTTMYYYEYTQNGKSPKKSKSASGSNTGGAGGAHCYAKCSTGNGAFLKWYEPANETSDHYITYNGVTYHFVLP